jgi:hypothetical protein
MQTQQEIVYDQRGGEVTPKFWLSEKRESYGQCYAESGKSAAKPA